MLPLAKEDVVTLDKLIKSILGQPDPLAKILAKLLIEKGLLQCPTLYNSFGRKANPTKPPHWKADLKMATWMLRVSCGLNKPARALPHLGNGEDLRHYACFPRDD